MSETCIKAFPKPRRQKETSSIGYVYEISGRAIDTDVTARLSNTVRRFPIRFISRLTGTARKKNQRKTIEGRKLAIVSERPKSAFT